jgi:hypothetical protein
MGRLAELATPVRASAGSDGDLTVRFVAAVVRGNLRLLVGMVHANRPWRLAARLSRALAAALATVVFALVFSDIWRLADGASWPRLLAISISSISATTIWLVAVHGLWERRGQGAHADEQVVLFDLVTVITVLIGMLTLYVMLFLLTLAAAALLLPPVNLEHALHHPIDVGAYARLAWLASSLATVVGALGSGLESDTAVREAAYGYIPEQADDQ